MRSSVGLHSLASKHLRRESPGHTLQPTALVHEAYLKLRSQEKPWRNLDQFLALAATSIRRVLLDHARARQTGQRGGKRSRITLADHLSLFVRPDLDILAIHESLEKLASFDPRKARLVELRFFGGLTVHESAIQLGISDRVAADDWAMARAWLQHRLGSTAE